MQRRVAAVLLGVGAAGMVALGAQTQDETYLHDVPGAAVVGYGILLTSFAASLLGTGALWAALPGPPGRRRALGAAKLVASGTVGLFLLQQAWINAIQPDRLLYAQVSVSPLANNVDATPSLALPLLAVAALAAIGLRSGVRDLGGRPRSTDAVAARLAAQPFLAVTAMGLWRILAEGLPRGEESVYVELLALLAVLYAAVSVASLWVLLDPASPRAHRLERILARATLGAVVAGLFRFETKVAALDKPLAFSTGLEPHTVLLALLAVPLWPLLRGSAPEPQLGTTRVRLGVAAAWLLPWAAAATAFLDLGALMPWLAAALAAAVVAAIARNRPALAAALAIAAFAAWGIGNTEAATYDPASGSGFLQYWPAQSDTPLVLDLWRLAAVALGAVAVALELGPARRRAAAGFAACLAAFALIELPMAIVTDTATGPTPADVGARILEAGSFVAQQEPAVGFVLHGAALAVAAAAGLFALRLAPRPPASPRTSQVQAPSPA